MQYISKGAVAPGSTMKKLTVNLRGMAHILSEQEAAPWLIGQFAPQSLFEYPPALKRLTEIGLTEITDEDGALGRYRLLYGCIIAPVKLKLLRRPLNTDELPVWEWINTAGLRLTVAELIRLAEKGISPQSELLGAENRQNLVESIYSADTIADNVLEPLMEKSVARDVTVESVLGLLRKKRILLI